MPFKNEKEFEDALVAKLTQLDNQWSRDILEYKTEEELIDNRYIEEATTSETYKDEASTRYRLNTTLTVAKNTIQNLNFENINEGKYLRLKFKLDYDNDTE